MADDDYELLEREAILTENNPDMHPVHIRNKAVKEIRQRPENWRKLQELLKKESE